MPPKRKTNEDQTVEESTSNGTGGGGGKKSKFVKPVLDLSDKEFMSNAKSLTINIGDNLSLFDVEPCTFNTGSFGWKGSSKFTVKIVVDGVEREIAAGVTMNITVPGSKPRKGATKTTKAKATTSKQKAVEPSDEEEKEDDD